MRKLKPMTYAVRPLILEGNSYPQRVDAPLVLICSCRGFIGFGLSYGALRFIEKAGYEGAFNICASITAALMFMGIIVYIFGKQIRKRTQRFAVEDLD
jgi:hypothetical protein